LSLIVITDQPLLTPALLLAQKLLGQEITASTRTYFWLLSISTWATISIALLCTLSLSDGSFGSVLATIAVLAQFIVYLTFMPRSTAISRLFPYISEFEDAIVPLSRYYRYSICCQIGQKVDIAFGPFRLYSSSRIVQINGQSRTRNLWRNLDQVSFIRIRLKFWQILLRQNLKICCKGSLRVTPLPVANIGKDTAQSHQMGFGLGMSLRYLTNRLSSTTST